MQIVAIIAGYGFFVALVTLLVASVGPQLRKRRVVQIAALPVPVAILCFLALTTIPKLLEGASEPKKGVMLLYAIVTFFVCSGALIVGGTVSISVVSSIFRSRERKTFEQD